MEQLPFPAPDVRIGGRKYWRKRSRREWVAKLAGQPLPAPQTDDEMLETSNQVRAAMGNVSSMWIWRHSRSATDTAAA
jgi:hypothetical protein